MVIMMTNEELRLLDLSIETYLKLKTKTLVGTQIHYDFLSDYEKFDKVFVDFNIPNPVPFYSSNTEASNKLLEYVLNEGFTVSQHIMHGKYVTVIKKNVTTVYVSGSTIQESLAKAVQSLIQGKKIKSRY